MFRKYVEHGGKKINSPESHGGSKEDVHWGKKSGAGRENAINKDGSIRHGKEPPHKLKKVINKLFDWKI